MLLVPRPWYSLETDLAPCKIVCFLSFLHLPDSAGTFMLQIFVWYLSVAESNTIPISKVCHLIWYINFVDRLTTF